MKLLSVAVIVSALFMGVGCTHQVMDTYPRYLSNNRGSLLLPRVNHALTYELTPASERHRKVIRSMAAGLGNSWVMEFGKAMHATMASDDVRMAVPRVNRAPKGLDSLHLEINVQDFDFRSHRAYLVLDVRAFAGGRLLGEKCYRAEGNAQGGKMFLGGAFAMRNAIQQSSKAAIDQALQQMLADLLTAISQLPAQDVERAGGPSRPNAGA